MKVTTRLLLVLLLLTAAASCATVSGVPLTYTLSPDRGNGLVVFSLTTNGPNAQLTYRRIGTAWSGGVNVWRLGVGRDWESPRGRLVVLKLPAGSYEIYGLAMIGGLGIYNSTDPFSVPFTIGRGRATYLGNIHLDFGATHFRMQTIDETERDLSLLFARYPGIQREYVDVTLSSPTPIR